MGNRSWKFRVHIFKNNFFKCLNLLTSHLLTYFRFVSEMLRKNVSQLVSSLLFFFLIAFVLVVGLVIKLLGREWSGCIWLLSMHAEVFSSSLELFSQRTCQLSSVRSSIFLFAFLVVFSSSTLGPSNFTGLICGKVEVGSMAVDRLVATGN